MAKRGLQKYLWKCIEKSLSNPNVMNDDSFPLFLDTDNGGVIFKIKSSWSFYIYISDNPCGDCSIYHTTNGVNFTGAKLLNNAKEESDQIIGLLRTKSGRSDLKDSQRTSSLSCSDKICRWLSLGLQGSLLSKLVGMVPIKGLLVDRDLSSSTLLQQEGLQRLIDRCPSTPNCWIEIVDPPIFECGKSFTKHHFMSSCPNISEDQKSSKRMKRSCPSPCGVNINWIREEGREVTLAHTGCIQGAIKANIGDRSCRSRLSRGSFLETIIHLSQTYPETFPLDINGNIEINNENYVKVKQQLLSSKHKEAKKIFLTTSPFDQWHFGKTK